MFTVKICGVTARCDALAAVAAGADAIGLNFCARSSRYIAELARARDIVQEVPPDVAKVGVFVNEPLPSICRIADELALDYVQLHGDEPAHWIKQLAPRHVLRAFRLGSDSGPVLDYLRACAELESLPVAVLIDALTEGVYGGTGKIVDWGKVRLLQGRIWGVPLILAGGLTPENVAQAIELASPAAVDVASGVEVAPGRKDAVRMAAFVAAARGAWRKATID